MSLSVYKERNVVRRDLSFVSRVLKAMTISRGNKYVS